MYCSARSSFSLSLLAVLPLAACLDSGNPEAVTRAADLRLESLSPPETVPLSVRTPDDVTARPPLSGISPFAGFSSFAYILTFGGTGDDFGLQIAADSAGNAYLTGTTALCTGSSAFVAKFNSTGAAVYALCLTGISQPGGIAADAGGNAYVGVGNGVVKLGPTGAVVYNVGLGVGLKAVAVDAGGNAYVLAQQVSGTTRDVLVGKLNAAGTALLYNVAFGGSGDDLANNIAVDGNGDAYVVGTTFSTNFPLSNAIQGALSGTQDAFVAKLNPTGNLLLYSTYLGGSSLDSGDSIAVDSTGNAYISGSVASLNGVEGFPVTSGAAQVFQGGGGDAWVTKLNASGAKVYATYVGGSNAEFSTFIAVDTTGAAVLTGITQSTNLTTTNGSSLVSSPDAFLVQLNPAGSAFSFASYFGGTSTDLGASVATDSSGHVYFTGSTFSPTFPAGFGAANHGSNDAYIIKLNP